MSRIKDLTGNKYGKLTVLSLSNERTIHNKTICICKCDCGNIVNIISNSLQTGNTTSCGCLDRKVKNLVNNKYGMLTVIKYISERDSNGKVLWKCKCDCGNEVISRGESLVSGNTQSCGCLLLKRIKETQTTHGMSGSLEYYIWIEMIQRCVNPNHHAYIDYGGRGITVYDSWRNSFSDWYAYIGPRPSDQHSIDRINNDGNYEPGNVRWSTRIEQSNNRRNNRIVLYKGKEYTRAELAREYNIDYDIIRNRLNAGWSVDVAVETPIRELTR